MPPGKMVGDAATWMCDVKDKIQARLPGLPRFLGMRMVDAAKDRVVAAFTVAEAHSNGQGFAHGGALMALADTLGAIGAMLNLRPGQGTTTIESKSNFLAGAPVGVTLTATAIPLHRGGRTQVWETEIRDATGRVVAKVTQTQIVLEPKPAP
jgi:uncharacterized protein (TIGR00369 family)